MRLSLSRFTLSSVAALALAGLIAGCSGGTSSSLPAASGGGINTPTNATFKVSKPVNLQAMGAKQMTPAQIAFVENALRRGAAKQPQRTSSGTGLPGAFGFVTTASPPGPYFGFKDQISAYARDLPPPNGFQLQSNGTVAQIQQIDVAPGGACLIPFVLYYNNGSGSIFNAWGYLDECAVVTTGVYMPLVSATPFYNTFVANGTSTTPPHIGQVVLGPPFSGTATWVLYLFNNLTSAYNTIAVSNGTADVIGKFGGFFWAALPEQTGPCVALPNQGIGSQNIQLANTQGGLPVFVPLAINMPGSTFTGFNQPNTQQLRCFKDDGTGIGLIYAINQGNPFPTGYYNGVGGQMLVTSHP